MIVFLIAVPLIAGVVTFLVKRRWFSTYSLMFTAVVHTAIVIATWFFPDFRVYNPWLGIDDIGLLFLSITSFLFLGTSFYGICYLKHETRSQRKAVVFISCFLFFLATMTLVTLSQHLELLWVGIEATTLASAPLIYFQKSQHSLEATWKYLMIGSVGIALALLGNFFFAVATIPTEGGVSHGSLFILEMIEKASTLQGPWLKAAFIFYVVGYGTKMGLAPLHSWLPDAHSESPSFVSALLSGSLLNCAFLGILRGYQICIAAGETLFAQHILLTLGILSMAFGAIFILKQNDYKRMLAYSSVEHMGILTLSMGIGGPAIFGGMLHAINHSFTKAMLFLVSGNILHLYKTKSSKMVSGVLYSLPFTGILWLIGFFAITGSPPFGTFVSEFIILKSAFQLEHGVIAGLYLLFLAIIFMGMAGIFLKMCHGVQNSKTHEPFGTLWPSIVFAVIILLLGFYIPSFLQLHLEKISKILGGMS